MFSRVAFVLCLYHIAVQSHVLNKTVYHQPVASNSTNTTLVQPETATDKQFGLKKRTQVPSERVFNTNESAATLNLNETGTGKSHKRQFSVSELLTTTFPKKTSNDTGLNPCKAGKCLINIVS